MGELYLCFCGSTALRGVLLRNTETHEHTSTFTSSFVILKVGYPAMKLQTFLCQLRSEIVTDRGGN
jgi:hypothetical protein